jgi:hypothetical protein
MTPSRDRYPFWIWSDLAMLIGLTLPSLFIGGTLAVLLGFASPLLKTLRPWTSMFFFYLAWFGCLYLLIKLRYGQPFWKSLGWTVPRHRFPLTFLLGPVLALSVGALGQLLHTPQRDMPLMKLIQGRSA